MNSFRLIRIGFLAWCCIGCQSHVLTKKVELSRDHTFISFVKTKQPFVFKGEIGGEHISYFKIIAFANEQYLVEITPENKKLNLTLSGKGTRVKDLDQLGLKKSVSVDDTFETFIEIALTSFPESDFTLTVTQLKKNQP